MKCNIDHKGRRVRFLWGLLMFVLAVITAGAGLAGFIGPWWSGGLTLILAAMGAFGIYEARKGWCAVRAMGIKTPV
jgi:fatty acid desaturase